MTSQEEHYLMFRDIGWLDADRDEVHEELEVCGRCVPKHAHFATRADVPTGPCAAMTTPHTLTRVTIRMDYADGNHLELIADNPTDYVISDGDGDETTRMKLDGENWVVDKVVIPRRVTVDVSWDEPVDSKPESEEPRP